MPSAASGTALERGLDGEHGRRSSIGLLASPPAFKGAGSGVVVSCQPQSLPGTCAPHLNPAGELAKDIHNVGKIANMKAELITRFKSVADDGGVTELVVWRVPQPVSPSGHGYKYRAVYVVDGVRVIGFDNERGKGDHCHLHGRELPYNFTTVDALVEDFIAAVDAARRTP